MTTTDLPDALLPYSCHGLSFSFRSQDKEALADCPWCGREGKFSVNLEKGTWRCFVCNTGRERFDKVYQGGNAYTFIRMLWERSVMDPVNLKELSDERKILYPESMDRWGVRRSMISNRWIVPAYNAEAKMTQLYRYTPLKADDGTWSKRLLPTSELGGKGERHGLFSPGHGDLLKPNAMDGIETVYLCEGPWDGVALDEVLRRVRKSGGRYVVTGDAARSLGSTSAVLAVPGANVFLNSWMEILSRKDVVLLYDSDFPRLNKKTGVLTPPAGYTGMRRVASMLLSMRKPPKSVSVLWWGDEGYDASLPDGTDVRDLLSVATGVAGRHKVLTDEILPRVRKAPREWMHKEVSAGKSSPTKSDTNGSATTNSGPLLEPIPCTEWSVVEDAMSKAVVWTYDMSVTLACMLATVVSTPVHGEPIWLKVIGMPSSGKTELCMALMANHKWVVHKSVLRGFYSGYKSDKAGEQDHSLIQLVNGLTLLTKDGDTILQAPDRARILSEARDIFDSEGSTHYRHGLSRSYSEVKFTWIIAGTERLSELDESQLGDRFLDVVVCDNMTMDLERQIGWGAVKRQYQEMFSGDSNSKSIHGDDTVHARGVTSGYIEHLRGNWDTLMKQVSMSDESLMKCQRLAEFVSFMRSKIAIKQENKSQRELSFRLSKQITKLAGCLGIVMNAGAIDAASEVMKRVKKVAMDTSRGKNLELLRALLDTNNGRGMDQSPVAFMINESEENTSKLLRFLKKIGVVETFVDRSNGTGRGQINKSKWRVTPRLRELYKEVML